MQESNVNDIQPFLFLIIGAAAILYACFKNTKSTNLKLTGERVEGIVFELSSNSNSSDDIANTMDKVTIRFVTKSKEWITADLNQDFSAFYTGQYKIGEKVDVYYDRQNPRNFFIDTKQSEQNTRIIFAVAGTIFFLVGLYKIFIILN